MINGHRVIAVIPARAGSKGVKNKNLKALAGKPLLARSVEIAIGNPLIDRVIVSTNGEEIAGVARDLGAEIYTRPEHLATDTALIIDGLRDLRARLRDEGETAKYMIMLEPTSPLRSDDDISQCLELLDRENFDSVTTFCEPELNPWRAWKIVDGVPSPFIDGAVPWRPRQKLPEAWQLNGAVYAYVIDRQPDEGVATAFGNIGAVIMPKERSLDIDDEADFIVAEAMIEKHHAH